jgi:hypothetical protein
LLHLLDLGHRFSGLKSVKFNDSEANFVNQLLLPVLVLSFVTSLEGLGFKALFELFYGRYNLEEFLYFPLVVLGLLTHFKVVVEKAHDSLDKLVSTLLRVQVYYREIEHIKIILAQSLYPGVD